jgi:hypothetical protein
MKSKNPLAIGVALGAGLIAVVLRVLPHPPAFTSVGACSLFGGARVRGWRAFALPIAVMVVSDLVLWLLSGFDSNFSLLHISRVYVYGCFLIYVAIGRCLWERNSILSTTLAATLGGLQFFIITNFCTWLVQPWMAMPDQFRYSRDLEGLMTCFVAALPFYQGETAFGEHPFALLTDFRLSIVLTILSDIIFTTAYLQIYGKLAQDEKQSAAATNAEAAA